MSWCSVCLEWVPCTLSAAHGWALLGVHCVQGDQHTHAFPALCLQPVAGARCSSLIHHTTHLHPSQHCQQPHFSAPVCFGPQGGGRRVSEPHVLCGSTVHVYVHVSSSGGKVVFFSLRLIICVWQWMWSVPFQVIPGAT